MQIHRLDIRLLDLSFPHVQTLKAVHVRDDQEKGKCRRPTPNIVFGSCVVQNQYFADSADGGDQQEFIPSTRYETDI